jgi:hypothetical protein
MIPDETESLRAQLAAEVKKSAGWEEMYNIELELRENGDALRAKLEDQLAGLSHEIWAAAQLLPNEGISDGVARIEQIIRAEMSGALSLT